MELYLKKLKGVIVVAIFLCLLPGETAGNDCLKDVSWKDTTYYRKLRIQGEWMKINCAIRTSENVTLWFGKSRGETTKKLEVDNKKVKLISKNFFNITNLTKEDHGWYTCQVCSKKHTKFLEVSDQGKAYAKPIVAKKPNTALFEIEGSVKLTCHAEGITVAVYDIIWYKQSSDGKFKKLASKGSHVNGMWTETLSLSRLSERDDGTYKCQINRYPLQYSANELVNISVKDPSSPKITVDNELVHFKPKQGKDFLLSYNVSSYPASHIKWWRSKDGISYELITRCSPSEKCEKHLGKENISKTSFEIKNLKYPEDNFFYKCNAFNKYGNASKTFQLEVYVKPMILLERTHIYEKGMIINCSLTKNVVNPPQVNYTWYSCGTSKCGDKNLKLISESYSLRLESQSNTWMKNYRCKANNAAGSAYQDIVVVFGSEKHAYPSSPKIRVDNELVHFKPEQGKHFLLSYNVFSYPASHIKWWRSKDGISYQLITRCSPSENCEKHLGKENISKTSFEIKNLKYPEDNFFYKCNAFNNYGNASKTFQLEVYVKPVILLERTHVYEKGMIINCSLTKNVVNPPQVNYTWYSCGTSKCEDKNLKLISESYSLRLESQSNTRMKNYRCKANNAAGSAYQDIVVDFGSEKHAYDEKNGSLISILLPIGVISMIVLVFLALYRRRKKIISSLHEI